MEKRRTDPNKGPPTIVIIGGRGTGKTYLVRDLMYYFRRIPAGMIITGSEASSEAFSEFFPKSFIFDDIDLERIENIVANQRKLRKKKTEGDYSSLLLFDDCGFDKSVHTIVTSETTLHRQRYMHTCYSNSVAVTIRL